VGQLRIPHGVIVREEVIQMLLGVEEVAAYLGLRPATIRRWVFERRFPTVKLGRRVLIRRDVVDDLVRRNERAAVPRGAAKL